MVSFSLCLGRGEGDYCFIKRIFFISNEQELNLDLGWYAQRVCTLGLNVIPVFCRCAMLFFFFFVLPAGWLLDRETRCFDEVRGTGQLLFGPVQFLGKSAIGWPNLSPQI